MTKNAEVARIFREIAALLEMEDVPFKPRAYEKAAASVESAEAPLERLHAEGGLKALARIPGVGKSFSEKIAEYLETGRIGYHQELLAKVPVDLGGLLSIEGLGPKSVKALYVRLGVRSVEALEEAARSGRVKVLPGFGEKLEQKILRGIGFLRTEGGRVLLGQALPLAMSIEERMRDVAGVRRVAVAGSVRRRKETVGDLDFLVVADRPEEVMERFVTLSEVLHVQGRGPTKSSVKLSAGLDADLRVVPAPSFGAALQYFTGNKDHNVALRRIAIEKGLKLNEYGVFRGDGALAGETEEEVYAALGLAWIAPELREDRGEIAAALAGRLPDLVEYGTLRGDLQTQTNWTDGQNSIEEMAAEARRLGLEYIAVTDHTRGLAMTRGSDETKLRRQMEEIERLNAKRPGVRILKGAEVNINRDGTLDIADGTLAALDVVGVAVHSHFNLSRAEMTQRICRAITNPHADILFHPTGRILHQRDAYDFDLDAVIRVAVETGTAIEIDAFPERLDLGDEHARRAAAAGAKIVIDSDAHHVSHLRFLDYGVAVARRAWVEKRSVLNTLGCRDFLAALKGGESKRYESAGRPRRRRPSSGESGES